MLTRDHNASNPAEAQRVRAAGGLVGRNEKEAKASKATKLAAKVLSPNIAYRTHPKNPMRVYPGGITLTRALGGRPLKMKSSCPVVADAETATVPVAGATHVILACDGVWDVLSHQEAVDFVRTRIQAERGAGREPQLSKICEAVFDRCIATNPRETRGIGGGVPSGRFHYVGGHGHYA